MSASAVSLASLVEELRGDRRLGPRVVFAAHLPAVAPRYGELEPELPPALAKALETEGAARLWSHQVEGIEAARRGEDVLVTTPTASGKSLVFQLPVLEAVAKGEAGRALFLFPLKALGQDQRAKIERLAQAAGLGEGVAEIYDGDTPPARRSAIRKRPPRVLISNPDMLHFGILGHWGTWADFLGDLRWVVLDELHTYRGIFGSHFHHVLQRFSRLCRGRGAAPSLIASSATAANAAEFAEGLAGRPFHWITDSGAPREGRHLLLLRPEASPYTLALSLFVFCLAAGLKTIVFTKARRITELLYSWLRRQEPDLAARVASYRAGFLPEERRGIERRLFTGELDGVISTSALEMGIDVGGLDACILVGYPGSMMATWQRSGRVGRAGRESLTALVALPDALDQYFLDHPEELLERPCERLIVDPANEPVSRAHLVCAAAEAPLTRAADAAYLERHAPAVGDLLREGRLLQSADGEEILTTERRPQRRVSLRGTGATYTIQHGARGRAVGTVDGVRVLHECHPGAVYLHGGRQFMVERLDLEERRARAMPVDVDYFTTPLTEKETEILEIFERRDEPPLWAGLGRLKVTERVLGYERKRIFSQESLGQHELDLPPVEFETVGLWWAAPRGLEVAVAEAGEHFLGALHASEHAAISLFPLLALCDRGDIGGISLPFHPQVGSGAVFLYDGHPGGVGIAARGFASLPELLERVLKLVEGCPCEEGCPSCIQSPKCGNGNRPLDKAGAAHVLRLLLGREESPVALEAPAPPPPPAEPAAPSRPAVEAGHPAAALPRAPARALPWRPAPVPFFSPVGARAPAAVSCPASAAMPAARRSRGGGGTVLFDVETRRSAEEVGGWSNAHKMGLSLGVVCHLEEGLLEVFDERRVRDLVAALRAADLVVGFNVKRFDYRVLAGYTGEDLGRALPTLDLLEEVERRVGYRVGLDHLARETLGEGKGGDGMRCLEWVRQGRLDRVEEYCRKDVEILRDLYLYGRREGYLLYRDRRQRRRLRVPVEW